MAIEGTPGISVGGACDRIDRRHAAIAIGGEKDGDEGDEIGAGRRALGRLGQHAEGSEDDHRRHISESEEDDGRKAERPAQFSILV